MNIKRSIIIISLVFWGQCGHLFGQWEVNSNSWMATNETGQKLPTFDEVKKGGRENKKVGIFYWTWHTDGNAEFPEVMNTTEIIKKYPGAVSDKDHFAWKGYSPGHFWWEQPLLGYYRTTDEWVLYKHAQMLANANIDVVFFDATNGSNTWKSSYTKLLDVWNKARVEGMNVPKIAFMLGFSANNYCLTSIKELYNDLYLPKKYPEMWFVWDGKPLIMAYPEMLDEITGDKKEDKLRKEIRNFFTYRPCQPDYVNGPSRDDQWNWLELYPQHKYGPQPDGSFEEMSVGVAQNASKKSGGKWHAFNDEGTFGRSYTQKNGQDKREKAYLEGLNFQEQWDRALQEDPAFIFVTGWNEWTAGRWINFELPTVKNFKPFAFVDQYNWEKSRDIEPVKAWGNQGDNYYLQLIRNVRKFKGIAPSDNEKALSIFFENEEVDWAETTPKFKDYRGDAVSRNHPGQGNALYYTNTTARNDIILAQVAVDNDYIYFNVKTAQPLTPISDSKWMRLFIDIDRNHTTGWEGYDFLLNRTNPTDSITIEKSNNNWNWISVGSASYSSNEYSLEIKIEKKSLGLSPGSKLNLEFKWSDNMQEDGNIMDFYVNGDVAPDGRFNYVYTTD